MTFLEKYELLKKSIPVPAIVTRESVDCEYVDYAYRCKNCYYCPYGFRLTDSIYTYLGWGIKLVDCDTATESEKCYECIHCKKCYNSTYLIDCNSSTDCHFSSLLNSCTDCFGCVSLTHKKYCIFNKQFTKQEYFKKVEAKRREKPEKLLEQMLELKKTIPHPASQQFDSENSPYGNYIYSTKNSFWCFDSHYMENSGYIYTSGFSKRCWDMFASGATIQEGTSSELCYQIADSGGCYNCAFLYRCEYCANCFYSDNLMNCNDCFGCVGLTKKKYCILNNQLTKDQYEKAIKVIRKELGWKN